MRIPLAIRRPATATTIAAVSFCTSMYFYLPVMVLYLQGRGLTLFQINTLQGVLLAAQFVAEVPTGVLADRLGRKRALLAALLLQLLGEALFIVAQGFWFFVLIQIIAGVGFAFASGTVEALVYDSLPEDGREGAMKRVMGRISGAGRIGNLLAFLASGALLAEPTMARFTLAIVLTVAAVGMGCLLALLVREPARNAEHSRPSSLMLLRDGVATLRRNPQLRRLVLLAMLSDPFGFYLIVLYQPYFVQAGVAVGWFGPALAVGSLLAAVADRYAYAFEERLGMRWGLLLATALPGVIYLLMAPVRAPLVAVALFCVQVATMNASRPLLRAYINGHVASEHRATVLSLIQLATSVYLVLIGLLLGFVADRSLPALFALMGALVLVGALLLRVDEAQSAKR
ncbi:MAG: MFS transporter [Chloroflexales bacterium]|nr:MFS transporter [Chloroflexales bacterium]